MKVFVPPIKSQGIKTKLVPWIRALVPESEGRWIEPFLGTGVVAFNAGFKRALLSDTNPHIINFYRQLQEGAISPERVRVYLENEGRRLKRAGAGADDRYRHIRKRFNREHDLLDFLFLSRAGFNGMMRFNRKGEWNIPFCHKSERFSKAYVTKIVNQVGHAARLIQPEWVFRVASFAESIREAGADDIIYCDPPYAGRHADYYNGWTPEDERRLFQALEATPGRFILSTWHHNDSRQNEMIGKYWKRFNIATRDHFYHAGANIENRRSVVEALVFNFEARIERHNHEPRPRRGQAEMRLGSGAAGAAHGA